jgi:UDP-glucose 4-epimerase
MKEKVIVTGGMGDLGQELVKELNKTYSVLVIDSLIKRNQSELLEDVQLSTFDISSKEWPALLRSQIKNTKYLFHLAGLTNNAESIKFPYHYHNSNVTGTMNLLSAATDGNIDKFIFASCIFSNGLYADPFHAQKAMGEMYCKMFHRVYGLNTLSTRIPKSKSQKTLKKISQFLIECAEDDSLGSGSAIKYKNRNS